MGILDRILKDRNDPEIPTDTWVLEAYYEYTRRLEKVRSFNRKLDRDLAQIYADLGVTQQERGR